jgi:hypothetical protein
MIKNIINTNCHSVLDTESRKHQPIDSGAGIWIPACAGMRRWVEIASHGCTWTRNDKLIMEYNN